MDPYLERYWDDVHITLCTEIRTALQPSLPKGLKARAGQSIRLEEPGDDGRRLRHPHPLEGDTVLVAAGKGTADRAARAAVTTVEPVVVRAIPALERDRWVQIIDTVDGNRVVTVVEILSPGHKRAGALNRRYRRKLSRYIEAGVNIVEIDLLRSSRTRLVVDQDDIPVDRRTTYYTCVNRAGSSFDWEAYPMPLRSPLPTVPIPCREGERDVPLPLQPIVDRVYVGGGYGDLDCSVPPRPPLSGEDAVWAAELVANRPADG